MKPFQIGIDALLPGGRLGGVEQVVCGLASGLSKLTDGDEEYVFFAYDDSTDWLCPYLSGPCKLVTVPQIQYTAAWKAWIKKRPLLMKFIHRFGGWVPRPPIQVPTSNGVIEKSGIDVMHFTKQQGFTTKIPSIYHPHDLQHLHLPHYFSESDYRDREILYRSLCRQAEMVAVASTWCKQDLIKHYDLLGDKVRVVPLAPPLEAYPSPSSSDLRNVQEKFDLFPEFIFFPAQTWPHKNHIGLIEALAFLKKKYGLRVPLVSSGHKNGHYSHIEKAAVELGVGDQVMFLGFVTPLELQCLYKLAKCVVIPTKFEAASFPLWEAFLAGVPAACSNVTSLPLQAGGAALVFDPGKLEEIAISVQRLWTDKELREALVAKGNAQVSQYSWERTARIFRAHYRRIGKRPLTDEDQEYISMQAQI